MDTHRPRQSILSLFDPLSERSPSPESDKENDAGEISFFNFNVPKETAQPHLHKLQRRLIDVGDMTMDDPSVRDLLTDEDELEAEINHSVAEDDENDTLTFRDMAKAATPKWSARKASTLATPKSSPTPRTPLADIFSNEHATPMARKKLFKRQVVPMSPKLYQVEDIQGRSPSLDMGNTSQKPASSPPSIEVSFEDNNTVCASDTSPKGALGSSVCTLNMPESSEIQINDTVIPVLVSPSSPESVRQEPIIYSPTEGTRLRPNIRQISNNSNRHSVDLQASFQLQMSSSDTTFDLLNDKISFFGSTTGHDTFSDIMEEGPSFDDSADFGIIKIKDGALRHLGDHKPEAPLNDDIYEEAAFATELELMANASPIEDSEFSVTENHDLTESTSPLQVNQPNIRVFVPLSSPAFAGKQTANSNLPSSKRTLVIPQTPSFLLDKEDRNPVSTPNTSNPVIPQLPPAVPALRIVKRPKTLIQRKSMLSSELSFAPSGSRRTSSVTTVHIPASRAQARSSPENVSPIGTSKDVDVPRQVRMTRRVAPAPTGASQSGDGPRRVLISEGPKLNTISNSRTLANTDTGRPNDGPRRIPVINQEKAPVVSARQVIASASSLKQPVKYATVGPASAIPKPVSRNAGSRLPAPTSGMPRFGVASGLAAATKGLPSRRVT